ncbi:MAG: M48 family metalloprotease [Rhizobiales bacterium]|nr:M48 family metalloprotease [Hyphomicrobiales bacterium]
MGEAVFLNAQRDLVSGDIDRRRAASLAAKTVSVAVLATPFFSILLGIWLIALDFPNFILGVVGAIILALGAMLLPRRSRNRETTLTRSGLPKTFDLLDRIATEMGTEPATGVHIIPDLNAYMLHVRNERVMGIGAVLWHALPAEQRVAIIAHEFAHQINGDPARSGLTQKALDTLEGWLWYLEPDTGELFTDLVMMLPYLMAAGFYRLLVRLMFIESQRAEYLADAIGARLSGAGALQEALKTISLNDRIEAELRGMHANRTAGGIKMVHRLANAVSNTPEEERKDILDQVFAKKLSVDDTHPPTAYRLAFLDLLPAVGDTLRVGNDKMAAIDAELEPHFAKLGDEILKAQGDDF